MNKLKSKRGETLVESLCAILVIAVVFVFLCGAIVSAARSNKQVRDSNQSFTYGDEENPPSTEDLIIHVYDGATSRDYTVTGYVTQDEAEGSSYAAYPYRWYTFKRGQDSGQTQ